MSKPLGGRGKKAPYETIQVRVPIPIKPDVEKLIEDFRNAILSDSAFTRNSNSIDEVEQCLKLVDRFIVEFEQSEKLHTRNNVNLVRFRDWLRSLNSSVESDTL